MYKITVPVMNSTVTRVGREESLKEIEKFEAARVLLAFEDLTEDKEKRAAEFKNLKVNTEFFKSHGYEVGAWIVPLNSKNEAYQDMIKINGNPVKGLKCPSCEGFRGFAREYYKGLAASGVDMILIDDGFRYSILGDAPGCLCPWHMKEIERIARHGYQVFAYDHTGCMESGGETTGGFVQSLIDLNDAICALQQENAYRNADISIVGHSWGGFSTLNIAALHPEVTHLVAMAGFISVPHMLNQFFGGVMSGIAKRLYEKEKKANPDMIDKDAISALKSTDAKVLVLHSRDDKVVSFEKQFMVMKEALSDQKNIVFYEVDEKGHNPNYTKDAVAYKDAFFTEYQQVVKKKQLKTEEQKKAFIARYDWNRMTEQDEKIWELIFKTLDA